MKPRKTFMAATFACAVSSAAFAAGPTAVDQEITIPTPTSPTTSFAGNSTDLFAVSAANIATAVLTPSTAVANVVTATYDAAINQLNGAALGSATHFKAARVALDLDPANVPLQTALAVSQKAYAANLTTVNNLKTAATVTLGGNDTFDTFDGFGANPIGTATITPTEGTSAAAQTASAQASTNVGLATTYYANGGTTVGATANGGFSDLEAGVIAPINSLGAIPPLDDNGTGAGATADNGFKDVDEVATALAAVALGNAQTAYNTVISSPTSTNGEIDTAAGALAAAQIAYVTAANTQYQNFSPITEANKTKLLGTILNGSWERSAILATATGVAANTVTGATNAGDIAKIDGDKNTVGSFRKEVNDLAEGAVKANTDDIAIIDGDKTTVGSFRKEVNDLAEGAVKANEVAIGVEVADRTALIRQEADGIHIGADSFIFDDVNDELSTSSDKLTLTDAEVVVTGNLELGTIADVEQAILTNETAINNEVINRIDADAMLQDSIIGETNARQAADSRLQGGISENTRGIAMVAAMTNTRVEAGKTHGVDFNMAQFQSETGFAFGYANRINDNLQVHGSLASTTDFDESVVRVGVAVQW